MVSTAVFQPYGPPVGVPVNQPNFGRALALDAADVYPQHPNLRVMGLGTVVALLGNHTPMGWLTSNILPASAARYASDRRFMTSMGAQIAVLEPRPGFPMLVGHIPSQNGKTVVITLGANDDVENLETALEVLRENKYGVVFYRKALICKDGKKLKHIGQKLPMNDVEEALIGDLDFLSRRLNDGLFGKPIPYEQQIPIGHSLGADLTYKMAFHSGRPYPLLVLLSPPGSLSDAFENLLGTETAHWFRRFVSPKRIRKPVEGSFDLNRNDAQGLRQPILMMNGNLDGLSQHGPEAWFEQHRENCSYVLIPGATHTSIAGRYGYVPKSKKTPDIPPEASEYPQDPIRRVVGMMDEALADSGHTLSGQKLTRFA